MERNVHFNAMFPKFTSLWLLHATLDIIVLYCYNSYNNSLLTTKEVNDIMTSETAQEGIHALEVAQNATNSHFISAAQYAGARHYILVQLTRSVGTSWRFETATIGQFKAAK